MKLTKLAAALAVIALSSPAHVMAGKCQHSDGYNKWHKQHAVMQQGYGKHHHGMHGYNKHRKSMHGYKKAGHGMHGYGKSGYGKSGYGKSGYGTSGYGMKGDQQGAYGNDPAYGKQQAAPAASAAAPAATDASASENNIVSAAIAAGSFSTLVDAVKAAGLVDTLKGEGPFTVFAPSDEAFAKIPQNILTAIVADKQALTDLLTAHVVTGELLAADVTNRNALTSLQGASLDVDTTDGVKVGGASVVTADIRTGNGVIHVIDSVILPN